MEEINLRVEKDERILITTLTKRMAEELTKYLSKYKVRSRYIHSDVDTLERVEIMQDLRKGLFDVLIGVNLLREGLDLPEVSLVIILDADKEGFLRSNRSLTQTIGRAARNINGKAIMYADKITRSMEKTINETKYRRKKQIDYNTLNNLVPQQINKTLNNSLSKNSKNLNLSNGNELKNITQNLNMKSKKNIKKEINLLKKEMEKAAKDLNFLEAARLRDLIVKLKDYLN